MSEDLLFDPPAETGRAVANVPTTLWPQEKAAYRLEALKLAQATFSASGVETIMAQAEAFYDFLVAID
jgi:hypothetical protein